SSLKLLIKPKVFCIRSRYLRAEAGVNAPISSMTTPCMVLSQTGSSTRVCIMKRRMAFLASSVTSMRSWSDPRSLPFSPRPFHSLLNSAISEFLYLCFKFPDSSQQLASIFLNLCPPGKPMSDGCLTLLIRLSQLLDHTHPATLRNNSQGHVPALNVGLAQVTIHRPRYRLIHYHAPRRDLWEVEVLLELIEVLLRIPWGGKWFRRFAPLDGGRRRPRSGPLSGMIPPLHS